MKTAVEWLYDNLKSHFEHDGDLLEVVQFSFKQAKEKEKEQKINFACDVYDLNYSKDKSFRKAAEDYYNETFKQQEQ